MEMEVIELVKPFEYSLTLTSKNNEIHSELQSPSPKKCFKSIISSMTHSDFKSLQSHHPSQALKKFQINPLTSSIHYLPGLKGGGQISSFLNENDSESDPRKQIKEKILKSPDFSIFLKNFEDFSSELKEGKIDLMKLNPLLKINPIQTRNIKKILTLITSKILHPKLWLHPMNVEERWKLLILIRNFLVFCPLTFGEDQRGFKLKLGKFSDKLFEKFKLKKNIDDCGSLIELETIQQLMNNDYWDDLIKICPTLMKIFIPDDNLDFQDVADKCEDLIIKYQFLVNPKCDYLSTLLEFFDLNFLCKVEDGGRRREKLIERMLEDILKDSEKHLGIVLNFLLNCDEHLSQDLIKVTFGKIIENLPGLNEGKIRLCFFFLKKLKKSHPEITKEFKKEFFEKLSTVEGFDIQMILPKLSITSLKVFKSKPFLKNHEKIYLDAVYNKKDIFSDSRVFLIENHFNHASEKQFSNVFSVSGERTLGKTYLSLNFILKNESLFQFIVFIKCNEKIRISSQFKEAFQKFNLQDENFNEFGFAKVLNILNGTSKKFLILLDDIQRFEDFQEVYVENDNVKYIITSRILLPGIECLSSTNCQDPIIESDGSIFSVYLGDFDKNNQIEKNKILKHLKNNPERLKLAASQILSCSLPLKNYITNFLQTNPLIEFEKNSLNAIINEGLSNSTQNFLKILSFFEPQRIPVLILEDFYKVFFNSQDFSEVKKELLITLLISEYKSNSFTFWNVEPSLMDHIKNLQSREIFDLILNYLKETLIDDEVQIIDYPKNLQLFLPHCKKFMEFIQEETYERAVVFIMINKYHYSIFKKELFEISVIEKMIENLENLNNQQKFDLMFKIGCLLLNMKLLNQAKKYFFECSQLMQNHQELQVFSAMFYLQYAQLCRIVGDYNYSSEFFKFVHSEFEQQGTHSQKFLLNLYQIDYNFDLGNFFGCLTNINECLKLLPEVSSNGKVLQKIIHQKNGMLNLKSGNLDYGKSYLTESIDLSETLSDPIDLELSKTYILLGNLSLKSKDLAKAQEFYLKSASIRESVYDPFHIEMAEVYFAAGNLLKSLKNYHQSSILLKKSLKIFQESLNENHLLFSEIYLSLGDLELNQNNLDSILTYLENSSRIINLYFQENHPDFITLYCKFGEYYSAINNFELSESFYLKALEIQKDFQDSYFSKDFVLMTLGLFYRDFNMFEKSLDFLGRCKNSRIESFSENHLKVDEIFFELGKLFLKGRRNDECLEVFQKCYQIRYLIYGERSLEIAEACLFIGKLYLQINDLKNCRIYLEFCLSIFNSFFTTPNLILADAWVSFASLELKEKNFESSMVFISHCLNARKLAVGNYDEEISDAEVTYAEILYVSASSSAELSQRYNPCISEAEQLLTKTIEVYSKRNNQAALAIVYFHLGHICNILEKSAEAISYFSQSVEINEKLFWSVDPRIVAHTRLALIDLCLEYCEYDICETHCLKNLRYIEGHEEKFKEELVKNYMGLRNIYFYKKNLTKYQEVRVKILAIDPNALNDEQ